MIAEHKSKGNILSGGRNSALSVLLRPPEIIYHFAITDLNCIKDCFHLIIHADKFGSHGPL